MHGRSNNKKDSILIKAIKFLTNGGATAEEWDNHLTIEIPVLFYHIVSSVLYELMEEVEWLIVEERRASVEDSKQKMFPFGLFIDLKRNVLVKISSCPHKDTVKLRVVGLSEGSAEEYRKLFHSKLIEKINGRYFNGEKDFREEDVNDFPSWEELVVSQHKREKIEDFIFSHFEVAPYLKEAGYSTTFAALFHGNPGVGKTYTIKAIIRKFVEMGIPVFNLTGIPAGLFLRIVKFLNFLPRAVFIYEDIENVGARAGFMAPRYSLSELLSTLDGLATQGSKVFLFTTNNIDMLDSSLKRKGRIDLTLPFQAEPEEVIRSLEPKLQDIPEEWRERIKAAVRENRLTFAEAHHLVRKAIRCKHLGKKFNLESLQTARARRHHIGF